MMTGTGARHETVHITCKLPGFKVCRREHLVVPHRFVALE